jgi:membrane protein implicated in regulation of membrane protease activity
MPRTLARNEAARESDLGDWPAATWWWIGAGLLVAAELASGTFYLLMIALGMAAGAVAAHLGALGTAQIATAAIVGAGATALWHWRRARAPRSAPFQSNRDVNLDVGERVHVAAWGADRTARVNYRGAGWTAVYAGAGAPPPGEFVISAVEGNRLIVTPAQEFR